MEARHAINQTTMQVAYDLWLARFGREFVDRAGFFSRGSLDPYFNDIGRLLHAKGLLVLKPAGLSPNTRYTLREVEDGNL